MTRNLQTLSRFSKKDPFSRGTFTPIEYTVVGVAMGGGVRLNAIMPKNLPKSLL